MMISQGYDLFVSRCAEGRHMTKEGIEKIAEGRVWTGEMAKGIGLVDELGILSYQKGYSIHITRCPTQ